MRKIFLHILIMGIALTIAMTIISCDKVNKLDLRDGVVVGAFGPDDCDAFIIRTDDNYLYKPSNLPGEYEIDSLLIRFACDTTNEWHNCGFGGSVTVVNLTHIEKR